ncbi:MAG: hypothetical protein SFU27_03670 [Thermonemataceae bacterium]|nr:hypothetical protein [Thermonemataceae bacterium]
MRKKTKSLVLLLVPLLLLLQSWTTCVWAVCVTINSSSTIYNGSTTTESYAMTGRFNGKIVRTVKYTSVSYH